MKITCRLEILSGTFGLGYNETRAIARSPTKFLTILEPLKTLVNIKLANALILLPLDYVGTLLLLLLIGLCETCYFLSFSSSKLLQSPFATAFFCLLERHHPSTIFSLKIRTKIAQDGLPNFTIFVLTQI